MSFELELAERAAFLELIKKLVAPTGELAGFFSRDAHVGVARAPGRLDVMGGIADYSGSLVLELPLREAALAAAQLHPQPELWLASVEPEAPHRVRQLRVPIGALRHANYAEAARVFNAAGVPEWAPYLGGVLVPLTQDKAFAIQGGVRILLSSRVPEGKGVSSSAAIEVASWFALAAAAGVNSEPREAALLCQRVENLVVGAPCGVMDQMTSAAGRRGELLELLCQPATLLGSRSLPAELAVFGIDSGVRHAVSGADYGQVRTAAFMGYRILAEQLGCAVTAGEPLRIDDARFQGYLANIAPSEFDSAFVQSLPERLSGAEFLQSYAGISDPVTRVDPHVVYPVRAATEHPIREHHRVRCFAELLGSSRSERAWALLGELMYQSHQSYSACGLGAKATDRLVELVRAAGAREGLYGAKITGGGSGGTVAVLAHRDAEPRVLRVARRFADESSHEIRTFSGSSAGAAELGAIVVSGAELAPRA
ncbi:MAG: GHMP kinase [Myxococcota bacterium]